MATRIVMPTFGMYTAEGTLARWLVEPGAPVEAGELVAEITTEKASYDIEAPASGVLHQVAKEGDPLAIEGLIGYVLDEGELPPEEPESHRAVAGGAAVSTVEATWRRGWPTRASTGSTRQSRRSPRRSARCRSRRCSRTSTPPTPTR